MNSFCIFKFPRNFALRLCSIPLFFGRVYAYTDKKRDNSKNNNINILNTLAHIFYRTCERVTKKWWNLFSDPFFIFYFKKSLPIDAGNGALMVSSLNGVVGNWTLPLVLNVCSLLKIHGWAVITSRFLLERGIKGKNRKKGQCTHVIFIVGRSY